MKQTDPTIYEIIAQFTDLGMIEHVRTLQQIACAHTVAYLDCEGRVKEFACINCGHKAATSAAIVHSLCCPFRK